MATFLEDARNRVLGHRKSKSEGKLNGYQTPTKNEQHKHASYSMFPENAEDEVSKHTSHQVPAWHVHKSSPSNSRPTSAPRPSDEVKAGRASINAALPATTDSAQPTTHGINSTMVTESIPSRMSSRRTKHRSSAHGRKRSDPLHEGPELEHDDSDPRIDLVPQNTNIENPYSNGQERTQDRKSKSRSMHSDGNYLRERLQKLALHQERHKQPIPEDAALDPVRPTRQQVQPTRRSLLDGHDASQSLNNAPQISAKIIGQDTKHTQLPPGFQLRNSQHTIVDEQVLRPVTREVVHHNVKEIRQEKITRDIHIHHYYTYTQPIKVVEILPAKHYVLDGVTGEKIEIPPPPGWQLPSVLQPHIPDTSKIKATERHYLVNEQYPDGILESDLSEKLVNGDAAYVNEHVQ